MLYCPIYINVGYSSGCLWRFKIITDADHGRTCRNYVLEVRAVMVVGVLKIRICLQPSSELVDGDDRRGERWGSNKLSSGSGAMKCSDLQVGSFASASNEPQRVN